MENKNPSHSKRVRNLIAISSLSAIVLLVSAFAWFIGMQTVSVDSFDIEIAATDGLTLSIDGEEFKTTVSISKADYADAYEGNTNNWAGRGLIPMSSVGEMDNTASRMKLYEKASLTATPGGYRLMASRVPNHENNDPERDGYVVFDLFIKNLSGRQYITALNPLDEEAIYLTPESAVTVATSGVEDTGIENSVRVAFAQIGRVIGTETDDGVITGISCTTGSGVTGICREAQIWEPNDTKHVQNAINWYNEACKSRTGAGIGTTDYSGACKPIVNGMAYPTYAVKDKIESTDKVDVYDGKAFNGYEGTPETLLKAYSYFTDTMKFLRGNDRPTFMTLAANSITKVRVYIYLEGQDIDNYDFASIGRKISVKFGFTKSQYIEDDIGYDGPVLNEGTGPDGAATTRPVVHLSAYTMELKQGTAFAHPTVTVLDAEGDEIKNLVVGEDIIVTGNVEKDVLGEYKLTYTYTDDNDNTGHANLVVTVVEDDGGPEEP